jgi:hypothetical protein
VQLTSNVEKNPRSAKQLGQAVPRCQPGGVQVNPTTRIIDILLITFSLLLNNARAVKIINYRCRGLKDDYRSCF